MTHDIVTEHLYDRDHTRVRVQHCIDDLRSGDRVWWCPKLTVDPLRLYQVIATWPHHARRGEWRAELGRLEPDVTVAGATYPAPSQTFLMPVDRLDTIGRFV